MKINAVYAAGYEAAKKQAAEAELSAYRNGAKVEGIVRYDVVGNYLPEFNAILPEVGQRVRVLVMKEDV